MRTKKQSGSWIAGLRKHARIVGAISAKDLVEALKNKNPMYRMVAKRNLEESIPLVATLTEIGKAHDVLPGQVALNWLVTYSGDTVVTIPGATKVYQAKESAGALTFNLSKADLEEIAEVSEIFL